MAKVQQTYALILGIVLLLVGIIGFFTDSVLGIFGVNTLQSVLHVIAGIFGIYVGSKGEGPGFNLSIGWIGIILAVLGFVAADFMTTLLNINMATTWLHLVIGLISLIVGYSVKN